MTAQTSLPPKTARVPADLRPIFDQFLAIQRRQVSALEKALAEADAATLARLAHAVKGSAATYQLPEAATLAQCLEQTILAADLPGAGRFVSALGRYFREVVIEFVENTRTGTATVAPESKKP